MSPPVVRVNTFVIENEKPHVDPISKMFIVSEVIFGLHRLPILGRRKFVYLFLTLTIYMIWSIIILYISFTRTQLKVTLLMWNKIIQNGICAVLSFTRCKFLLSFYVKLGTFDMEAAYRPKVSGSSIRNLLQTSVSVLTILGIYTLFPAKTLLQHKMSVQFVPLNILYVLEVHYYGHLLSLLVPRLRLINYYIESSLAETKTETHSILKEFVYIKTSNQQNVNTCQMRKLMDLYEIVVEAFDSLMEGIKWQLLVIILTAFISILGFLFVFTLVAIRSGEIMTDYAMLQVGMISTLVAPLFAPCTFSDRVQSEVKKLRELLSSKLYENKLEKSGRRVTRALLSYTETRDLSFRLLRMLNIDTSFPFKFLGLVVTYLIILLQFEKVINS